MIKVTKQHNIVILILVILGITFYWYEWRPSEIKKECIDVAKDKTMGFGKLYESYYKNCLREKGL